MTAGLPLVLLPGMNCSARLWQPVARELVLSGRDVVHAVGEGPDLESCVAGLLARLPEQFALAGVSLGGIVAMALQRRAPERIAGLCLVATSPLPPTDAQRASWTATVDRLEAGASARDVQEELLPLLVRPAALAHLREATLTMADEVGRDRLVDQLRLQATRVDEREGLRSVAAPTLVVAGDADLLCPVERHVVIHELVGSVSELVVLRDTGHLSPLERPMEVAAAMTRWLDRVDATS